MQATFDKKPTPRDKAVNRLLMRNEDLALELAIYKGLLVLIAMAAISNVFGLS